MRRPVALLVIASLAAAVLTAAAAPAIATTSTSPGGYVPIPQKRLVDTRNGIGVAKGALAGQHTAVATLTGTGGIPSTAAAVQATVTAVGATAAGALILWKAGAARPGTINLMFGVNQTISDTAVVPVSAGKLDIYNTASSGSVQVVLDVTGYYLAGTANSPGTITPLSTPVRIVNTASNLGHTGALAAGGTFDVTPTQIPNTATQAALTITVVGPTRAGSVVAYPTVIGGGPPATPSVVFPAAGRVSSYAVVTLGPGGGFSVHNTSTGTVQLAIDLVGYVAGGASTSNPQPPVVPGALQSLPPVRIWSKGVSANTLTHVAVSGNPAAAGGAGLTGAPVNGAAITAALVRIQIVTPSRAGGLTAFASTLPPGLSLSYSAGVSASNEVLVPTAANGTFTLYTGVAATVTVDLYGYIRATAAATPTASTTFVSRYVHSFGGAFQTSTGDGCHDAQAGYRFVLLHLGAQLNDKSGIELSGTSNQYSYPATVSALTNYLDAFSECGGVGTVAVATNNDAVEWTTYPASERGGDWAKKVVNVLPTAGLNGFTGPSVVGAFDAEPDFGTTKFSDALGWETAYVADADSNHVTPALSSTNVLQPGNKLVFTGAASGCPTTITSTAACTAGTGWTPAGLYQLARYGGKTLALPQIYNLLMAAQWADIDARGSGGLVFVGSLTESADCTVSPTATGCPSLTPAQGYAGLYTAISGVVATPSLPYAIDLANLDNG